MLFFRLLSIKSSVSADRRRFSELSKLVLVVARSGRVTSRTQVVTLYKRLSSTHNSNGTGTTVLDKRSWIHRSVNIFFFMPLLCRRRFILQFKRAPRRVQSQATVRFRQSIGITVHSRLAFFRPGRMPRGRQGGLRSVLDRRSTWPGTDLFSS